MAYELIKVPTDGEKITIDRGQLHVPDRPIIPFIEGDGTGPDIWRFLLGEKPSKNLVNGSRKKP